ncbi:MAG: hypothetical protein HYV06_10210 [Deltaproteobacteria bacterium]|nr:hypothetical protein [Deltaproteobacteria bacterium]
MKRILIALLPALAFPALAGAAAMSSPNYQIVGSVISSGGGKSDSTDFGKAGVIVGQGVFIPPADKPLSSPSFTAKAAALAGPTGSLSTHTGDINGNGGVDIIDALLALRCSVGLFQPDATQLFRGDVGPLTKGVAVGDGRIDIEDAMLILRKAVGLWW